MDDLASTIGCNLSRRLDLFMLAQGLRGCREHQRSREQNSSDGKDPQNSYYQLTTTNHTSHHLKHVPRRHVNYVKQLAQNKMGA